MGDFRVPPFPREELLPDRRNPHTPASIFIEDQLRFPGSVDSLAQPATLGDIFVKTESYSVPDSNAPIQHTDSLSELSHGSYQATDTRKLRVIYWLSPYSEIFLRCAKCLALNVEVLLFSARRSYAWIADQLSPDLILRCWVCEHMRTGGCIDVNVYLVRPIPTLGLSDDCFRCSGTVPLMDVEAYLTPKSWKREPKEEPMIQHSSPPHKKI